MQASLFKWMIQKNNCWKRWEEVHAVEMMQIAQAFETRSPG